MRFFIILGLVAYVLYKVGGLFFKAGAASQSRYQQRRPQDVNNNPDAAPKKDKRNGSVKGGDYIDYEEVK